MVTRCDGSKKKDIATGIGIGAAIAIPSALVIGLILNMRKKTDNRDREIREISPDEQRVGGLPYYGFARATQPRQKPKKSKRW